MPDLRGKRAVIILACVILLLSAFVLTHLVRSAVAEDRPEGWQGRIFGFAMAGVSVVVAAFIVAFAKRGETHYWGMVGALVIAALLTGGYSYKTQRFQTGYLTETIPLRIGDWQGIPQTVDDETYRVLETRDIIQRLYVRGNDRVYMAVIFAMGKRRVAHPPEQCFGALGMEFEEIAKDSFTTAEGVRIEGRRLVMSKDDRKQTSFYWYKAGDLNTGSFVVQQIHIILSSLLMRSDTRVALIRLDADMQNLKPAERQRAMALIRKFAREVFPEIERALALGAAERQADGAAEAGTGAGDASRD